MKPDTAELRLPEYVYAFDTEDDGCGNMTQLAVASPAGVEHLDPTPKAFFDWCDTLPKGSMVFAHNFEYDAGHILQGYMDQTMPIIGGGGRLIGVNVLGGPRLRCTWLHFNASLAKVGKTVGLEKLDFAPNDRAYCERDTEICLTAALFLRDFYERRNAKLACRVSSSALSIFLRNFLDRVQTTPDCVPFQRKAYFGGRCECYALGEFSDVYAADIKSSYPYVMKVRPFPDLETAHNVERFNLKREGICTAYVVVPDMPRPPLPVRTKRGNVYPVGQLYGTWTAPELRYAQERGCKVITGCGVQFCCTWQPFTGYIDALYELKRTGDAVESNHAKLMMNSLYGMFGAKGDNLAWRRKRWPGKPAIPWGKGWLIRTKRKLDFAAPIWAAYITAYARVRLARFMDDVQDRGGRVIYCDTDSVYYTASAPLFPVTDTLGAMNHDGRADMILRAPKVYSWGDKVKVKGLPKATLEHVNGAECGYDTVGRLIPSLKLGTRPNVWRRTSRAVRTAYDKRTVHADGSTSAIRWPIPN